MTLKGTAVIDKNVQYLQRDRLLYCRNFRNVYFPSEGSARGQKGINK